MSDVVWIMSEIIFPTSDMVFPASNVIFAVFWKSNRFQFCANRMGFTAGPAPRKISSKPTGN